MGQAWCKEKTSKAQDSKSPLDRVFVRCAHRIYPGLKEEGSVLGGATQRVTSSEIGYAGSPPREVLTRGRSIDSVDRPFHPSDWVDVNLEVPSTPRASSVLTNLTVDTSLYPATTPTSSCSNLKDPTPVPPPRRRKRNKGRPLPPKPDEIPENPTANSKQHAETGDEPLYSSVKSPKSSGDEQDAEEEIRTDRQSLCEDAKRDGRKTKEIYEHKVNGTGRIISSDVVSGKRTCHPEEKKAGRGSEQRKAQEDEEYERFARSRTSKDASTPYREDKRRPKDLEIKDSSRDTGKLTVNARTKNYSTVSLPNYDELDVARHQTTESKEHGGDGTKPKSRRPVRSSTGSLPAGAFLSPFSEKTSVRLEDYIPRPDNLTPYQVLEKLNCGENGFVKYDPSKSEDWGLNEISNCELNHQRPIPFEDTSGISDKRASHEDEDVVDFSTSNDKEERSPADRDITGSSSNLQKPEAFGKSPSPTPGGTEHSEADPNGSHLRYFDPPTLEDTCGISSCGSPSTKEPFFLDETKYRSALDTIGGSCGKGEPDRSGQSRMIFGRSLSNESEPNEDTYETKELQSSAALIRTISEESLPREMLEEQELDDFFDEKLAKDAHNNLRKSLDDRNTKTPPPSPEPRIKAQVQDGDHSTLLKVLKEEAAEESNLSSMTPSLTELEAALSDMLEKEDSHEAKDEGKTNGRVFEKSIEPEIVPVEKTTFKHDQSSDEGTGDQILAPQESKGKNETPVSLGQILENKKPGRKVSFCAWEETMEAETRDDREFVDCPMDSEKKHPSHVIQDRGIVSWDEEPWIAVPLPSVNDIPPEKPSRLNRILDDLMENSENVPTPPRRRNKASLGVAKREIESAQNGSAIADVYLNDRLI